MTFVRLEPSLAEGLRRCLEVRYDEPRPDDDVFEHVIVGLVKALADAEVEAEYGIPDRPDR